MTVKLSFIYFFALTLMFFYTGQTEELKQRTRKHRSDVNHPNNSKCKKFSKLLRTCSKLEETYFKIYLVFVGRK